MQKIGLFSATTLVIGSCIGSGIFVSPASMARELGSPSLLMGIWIFAGIISMFGAFSQAELASRMPRSGGLYEYFRELYGDLTGFFYGWATLAITESGSIAALGFIFARYIGEFVGLTELQTKIIAACAIIFLTFINTLGIRIGSAFQNISTTAKVLAILAISLLIFLPAGTPNSPPIEMKDFSLFSALTAGLAGAFWSYSGWGTISNIADEIHEPNRNVPRAIIIGLSIVMVLYLVMNFAYLNALGINGMAASPQNRVASFALGTALGPLGAKIIAALVVLSAFDCLNSTIIVSSRIGHVMAKKRVFFPVAAKLHPKFHTPVYSLWIQTGWALVLLFSGSFESVTEMLIFVNWFFYVLIGIGVFLARKRQIGAHLAFKMPGFPIIPILFTAFALIYSISALTNTNSLIGLLLVATGLPFYLIFKRAKGVDVESKKD